MRKENSMDMVNGPLWKNLFIFAIPLMFSSLLQMLFNAADTIVVGKFAGQIALAAVGSTGSLIFLVVGLFNGLGVGANVLVAQKFGSKDEEGASIAVHTTIALAIICGIGLTIVGITLARRLLNLISTPADIIDLSQLYMQIYFLGTIFQLVYNFGAAILRSKGDTQKPMYFLIVSGILNVVLNLLFVIGFSMSVAGVAIATVASQGLSALLVMKELLTCHDATHIYLHKLRLDRKMTMEILKIGIPAGIQGCVFSLSNTVIQSSINSFDSSAIVAGNSAGANLENFVYIGMMAFSQACITFTSQNIGANRKDNVKKVLWSTLILDIASALIVGVIVNVFSTFFLSLYTDSSEVMEVGKLRLFYIALFLALNGVLDIFIGSLRGMGQSLMPTIVMIVGICGVRLLWIATIFPLYRSIRTIYLCYPISWFITSSILIVIWIYYYRKLMKED